MRHAHGNCDIHTNAYGNSHADANRNSDIHTNDNAYIHSDSYTYSHSNSNTYGNSNCNTDCYINACYSNAYCYSNPGRSDTDTYSKASIYSAAAPHAGTAPVTFGQSVPIPPSRAWNWFTPLRLESAFSGFPQGLRKRGTPTLRAAGLIASNR